MIEPDNRLTKARQGARRLALIAITEGIEACRDPTSFLRLARGGGERARRRISQDASI